MSRMDDDLFTYEVEILGLASVPFAEIFRINTNVFDFETPTCRSFNELNYLLQINPDVLTKYIDGFKTYEEYKDDWIYKWNKDIPWKDDGYCNGGNLPRAYIVGNTLRYQNLEWYEALEDGKLKDEALKNKAIMEGMINKDDESHNEGWRRWDGYENTIHNHEEREIEEQYENEERCELFNNPHHETPVCKIRRFEMIKYSFGQDEEYVAIKECEYEDLTITNEDACRAYQEIFRSMDKGWMVLSGKEIDKVGEVLIIWNPMCVVVILASKLIMEYLVKISKKARILELKQRNLKITVLTSYTPYPSRKIQLIMEYLVKNNKKARNLEVKRRHLNITVLTSNTPYPSRKIR
ncbi:hypothetical protein Tco_0600098, partial [Tanacetum coccineum]